MESPHKGPVTRKCFLWWRHHVIEAERCIYSSVNWANFGPDNGFTPVRCQTIIWTNPGLLLIGLLGLHFISFELKPENFNTSKCVWKCCLCRTRLGDVIKWNYFPRYWPFVWGISLTKAIDAVTGEFPAQFTSNAENVSIWWRHHENSSFPRIYMKQWTEYDDKTNVQ